MLLDNLIRVFTWGIRPMTFGEGPIEAAAAPPAPVPGQDPEPNDGGYSQDPAGGEPPATPEPTTPQPQLFSWKEKLSADLRNSTIVQKFDDTQEGLVKAVESHASLEKMLGHEKVPIPKGDDDHAGWHRFHKAMGVPDKPEGYELPDVNLPESLGKVSFDKESFSKAIHGYGLTPKQASGLWENYTNMMNTAYANHIKEAENQAAETRNQMLNEWGDAYEANVELGQLVINKFSTDKGMEDHITAQLGKDPLGVKFLATIGAQFAESKVGEFGQHRFAKSPDEAQAEIDRIVKDDNHPYNNDKASPKERESAINYVNSLYAAITKARQKKEGVSA